jgi:hypothetical protein
MNWTEFSDIPDWLLKNECYPFEDSLGNLCITVESKYASFGGEKDARLKEAKYYGIDKLIRFYGKVYFPDGVSLSQVASDGVTITISQASVATITPTKLYDAASTPEHSISPRECVRMRVLVKIPKETFDKYTVNDASCDINKPSEGYLSAFISVENYERDIDYITTSMEDFLPKMAKADKYMTNINIVQEIKNLKNVKDVIGRYFDLNSVTAAAVKEEECEPDKQSQIEIGFSYDYKPAFVLIDGNKHTIGYDCFLEASLLNHATTANYLIQLGNMSLELTSQLNLDFDIFQFLSQHTYPTPVIEVKKNSLDGIEKYDANGNLFSFANLAKLITLDLDKKSCKTDEEGKRERDVDFNADTKRIIAETARQSREFVGNMTLSESKGWKGLKKTGGSIREASFRSVFDKITNDVLNKIDFNCVLEESLKCSLEAAITRFGEAALNDPDLSEFFNADGVVEVFGFGGCGTEGDCEKELQLKVGLPAFQGINIPGNFPTIDYLAFALDAALKKLYDMLISAIVSFITGIFELLCKAVSATDFSEIGNMFGSGFTSWLSKTIGVDLESLKDGEAWADAVLSSGGTGFMGVIGNFVSKTAGSRDSSGNWVWGGSVTALYSGTGVALNLPNPGTGEVEEMFISSELIYQTMSGVQKATEILEDNLSPEEYISVLKSAAPEGVKEVAFGCLNRDNPEMFQTSEDVTNLFSALGEIVNSDFLEDSETIPTTITNACQLGDGSSQDTMARNRLKNKDPLLSDSEIEELLSQEKNRLIEKIKKIHKLLKEFRDGTLFPSLPSLFGSDDSLIPEPPPIISDAMKKAASGMYGSAINNLNTTIFQYPDIWSTVFNNKINETTVNLRDLYGDSQTTFSVNNEGDTIVMGYSLPEEVTIIEPEQYIEVLEGSTMVNGWWFLAENSFGKLDGIDLGNYHGGVGSEATEKAVFIEMLGLMGLVREDNGLPYEDGDRRVILKEMQDATELLRELYYGRGMELLADFLTSFNFLDWLGWNDLKDYKDWVIENIFRMIDEILSQIGVTLEQWKSFDSSCQQRIWDETPTMTITKWTLDDDGEWEGYQYKLKDSSDMAHFNKVITLSDTVESLYFKAKQALVVMDIADFYEEWDDEDEENYKDPTTKHDDYNNNHAKDRDIEPKPEFIDGSWDDETDIGQVTLSYNITDVINPAKKQEIALAQNIENPDDLSVTALITLKSELKGYDAFYTKASLEITKAGDDIAIDAVREDSWTSTLTTLERKGVRLIATTDTSSEEDGSGATVYEQYQHGAGSLANIYSAITNGGNSEYDVVPNNKIITSIGNYKIANDLMISLGRKESKSNLLKEKYSFNTDNASYGLLDWFSAGPLSSGATAGQYTKLVIDSGGTQSDLTYTLDYMFKMQGILDDMRERVMTSQYRSTGSIGEMMDSYSTDDAIKYKDLTKWAEGNVIDVMKIQQLDEMCDALTPNRRTAASMGVRLLAREFILESVLISLQVFDTFSTGFMESEAFSQTIFDNMKTEMKKYDNSFDDTIKNSIFSDIKDAAVKYYEYRSLLGEEIEVSSGKSTLISIISEEINEIRKSIVNTLQLSETGTWDDFVFDEILPAAGFNIIEGYNEGEGYYFTDVETIYAEDMEQEEIVTLFSSQCGGTADEGSKEGGDTNVCGDIEDIILSGKYLTVRQQLFDNEEYKEFINHIFPLRELVTQLSVYQSSALSDVAVFSGTYEGRNLFDIFAETKLSTLQVLLASIHGAGETTYIDPFLEKLKT